MRRRIGDTRQMPAGVDRSWNERNCSDQLPIEAGTRFKLVSFIERSTDNDPYALYNIHGMLLHEWADGYVPSFEEIRQEVLKHI